MVYEDSPGEEQYTYLCVRHNHGDDHHFLMNAKTMGEGIQFSPPPRNSDGIVLLLTVLALAIVFGSIIYLGMEM